MMSNAVYLSTLRSCAKVLQLSISMVILTLYCGNWSKFTCFQNPLLGTVAALTLSAFLIMLALFAAGLVSQVPTKIEYSLSLLCALLTFAQFFMIAKFFYWFQFEGRLIFATVLCGVVLLIFVYLSAAAIIIYRMHCQQALAKRSAKTAVAAKVTATTGAGGTTDHSSELSPHSTKTVGKLYKASNFNFQGSLKIPKHGTVEMAPLLDLTYEEDSLPNEVHLKFTESDNVVYDIGSEVEQLVD